MSKTDDTPNLARIDTKTNPLTFPDNWTLSESWQRAQTESDEHGGPINDAERMVWLENSDEPHRVTFVLIGRVLRVNCDCEGYHYRDFCAHIASCWWRWINDDLRVTHHHTGNEYDQPPGWLDVAERGEPRRYDDMTPKQLEAYLHCEVGDWGVTEYAEATGRAKGTIGNQLSEARKKEGRR